MTLCIVEPKAATSRIATIAIALPSPVSRMQMLLRLLLNVLVRIFLTLSLQRTLIPTPCRIT